MAMSSLRTLSSILGAVGIGAAFATTPACGGNPGLIYQSAAPAGSEGIFPVEAQAGGGLVTFATNLIQNHTAEDNEPVEIGEQAFPDEEEPEGAPFDVEE